ncbi:4a-hydroxytetrahydrobiopterin dehydratase [Embleya sp. MST-111070]|uniref:4a-hydroxytetrahydrobiopterin dehydratase n=1 Tax=Embleya sp. MST-111070 TaxID=3398231 RepID=UPI003F733E6C
MTMAEALTLSQIERVLSVDLPGWTTDGRRIERTYSIPHVAGAAFVVHIAAIQDDWGHHSDATLGYKTVHISISSSDLGGHVAEHDIELARRIEAVAPSHGAIPID